MHLSTLLQALLQHEICLLECEITSIVYPYSFANFTKPLRLSYAERETTIIMVVLPDVGIVLMLTVVASGHRGRANAGGRESRRGKSIPRGMGGAVW
ncbi:Os12g0233333 [Oryza sativa Japonica Group]|uniref:Os12g0233333 protein n=1 Tax=Oryza sativa subsp. japonica TaxID=39947 RepID=C7J9P6_ORYSJ|nr:Os12g0233333 [Oryza sativa Japonica Group]|eukprot:NP_001176856.1 Os12g0233333 [Oryza sativa Japonica Group]